MARKKKKERRSEAPAQGTPESSSVHVSVSGHSLDDVHNKLAALHGRGSTRKGKRRSKRQSHRE